MEIDIARYKAADVSELIDIANQPGMRDWGDFDTWAMAQEQAASYTYRVDGNIVAIAGATQIGYRKADVWAMMSPAAGEVSMTVARHAKELVDTWVNRHGYDRLECQIPIGWVINERFIEWLGFEAEGIMRKAGATGGDVTMYSFVKEGAYGGE